MFYDVSAMLKRGSREAGSAGRAQKGRRSPTKTIWRAKASVGPLNEEAYEHAKQKASCFVLITNIHDAKYWRSALRIQKQSCVELSFKAIKGGVRRGLAVRNLNAWRL